MISKLHVPWNGSKADMAKVKISKSVNIHFPLCDPLLNLKLNDGSLSNLNRAILRVEIIIIKKKVLPNYINLEHNVRKCN